MHAFLLINSDPNQFAKEQNARVIPFVLQKIEESRDLKKLTKFSFSEKTAILISDIDKATPEALNAFLKNLEEPTKNIIYILTAKSIDNVLPTIVSRCEVIRSVNKTEEEIDFTETENFLKLKTIQQLDTVGKVKERGEAIRFVENVTHYYHQNGNFDNLENCLQTIDRLKKNGNVSLQLANFVVRMSSYGR